MHKICFLLPSAGGELSVICFNSKPNFDALNPIPEFTLLSLLFVFSRSFFSRSTASIFLSCWFDSISSGFSMYSSSIIMCALSSYILASYWSCWSLLLMIFLLGSFPCLMGARLNMYLLWCFLPLIIFQWCHHHSRLHVLKLSRILRFVSRHLCLWLGYL